MIKPPTTFHAIFTAKPLCLLLAVASLTASAAEPESVCKTGKCPAPKPKFSFEQFSFSKKTSEVAAESTCSSGTCSAPAPTGEPTTPEPESKCEGDECSLFDAFNGATSEVPAMPT